VLEITDSTDAPATPKEMRGIFAAGVVLAGVVAVNGGNYAANLISARFLGPAAYGDLVALLALSALVGLPLGALQIFTSRYVARFAAQGDIDATRILARRSVRLTLIGGLALSIALDAAVPVLRSSLGIASTAGIVLVNLLALPNLMTPVVWGVAQGLQRFRVLSTSMAAGTFVRLVFLIPLLAVGAGVPGAVGAALIGGLASLAIPFVALRAWFAAPGGLGERVPRREATTYLVPVAVGILAITSLSSIDVLVAKASFGGATAGVYGSASLIGRLVLYVPTAIVTVLLPKVAARSAAGQATTRLLAVSLAVTVAFGGIAAASYAGLSHFIVSAAFGNKYEAAGSLLWMFAVAMTAYAIMNVFLYYHLGRGNTRVSWFLLAGAIVQGVVYAFFHSTPRELVTASICVGWALVTAEAIAIITGVLRPATPHRPSNGTPSVP
jgi:O-antigen/teichoic acid export membrane protein